MLNIYYTLFLPYILMAFLSIDKRFNENLKILIVPTIVLFVLFSGLQYGISDYWSYLELYQNYNFSHLNFPFFNSYKDGGTGHEFLYSFLSTLYAQAGFPFAVFLLLIALLAVGMKLYFLKLYSPYFFLSFLVYLALILIKDMTQLRANVATSIIFFSILAIQNRKPFIFTLMILIASSFHVFALTALPLYWLATSKNSKRYIKILMVAGVIIGAAGGLVNFLVENLTGDLFGYLYWKLKGYSDNELNGTVNPFGIGNIFQILFVIYGIYKWDKLSDIAKTLLVFIAYGIFGYMIVSDLGLLAYRFLEMYVHLSLAILFSMYIYIGNKKEKYTLWLFMFVYSLFFMIQKISFSDTVPYNNILFM